MPTAYQSIIRKTEVTSNKLYLGDATGSSTIGNTEDYLFLSAEREVNRNSNNSLQNTKLEIRNVWISPWHWMILGNINNVYGLVPGSSGTIEIKTITDDANHTNDRYFRYRFSGHYIKPTARIFRMDSDPSIGYQGNGAWTWNGPSGSVPIRVASGDVWVNNGGTAYMYFTNADIAEGKVLLDADKDQVTTNGAWKRADIWHLRTYNITQRSCAENLFEKVDEKGSLVLSPSSSTSINEGRLLCPEFTV